MKYINRWLYIKWIQTGHNYTISRILLLVCFFIFIAFWVILFWLDPEKDLKCIENIIELVSIGLLGYQIIDARLVHNSDASYNAFLLDKKIRSLDNKANKQLRQFYNSVIIKHNFDNDYIDKVCKLYKKAKYKDLREYAFFYDYLGFLVMSKKIDFELTFNTTTFPDWLINSRESILIINLIRNEYPDYLAGAEFLYLTYNVKRLYNKKVKCNSSINNYAYKNAKNELTSFLDEYRVYRV